jgi:DNA-binding MarR family transcriptional regulator
MSDYPRPLIFRLYTTYQRSGELVSRALAGSGIRPEDAALLNVLDRDGPATPTELSRKLGIGASTLSYRLKTLEAQDVLSRRRNPADGRSAVVELTPRAQRHWQAVIPAFAEALRRAERRIKLPHDEVAAALDAIAEAIDEELAAQPSSPAAAAAPRM